MSVSGNALARSDAKRLKKRATEAQLPLRPVGFRISNIETQAEGSGTRESKGEGATPALETSCHSKHREEIDQGVMVFGLPSLCWSVEWRRVRNTTISMVAQEYGAVFPHPI